MTDEPCKRCGKSFPDNGAFINAIRCTICRRPFHDGCASGISDAALVDIKTGNSRLRWICSREVCTATDNEESPLYSTSQVDAVVKEETEKIRDKFAADQTKKKLEKTTKELADLKKKLTELKASTSSTSHQTIIDGLSNDLKLARDELNTAREEAKMLQDQHRRMSRGGDATLELQEQVNKLMLENRQLRANDTASKSHTGEIKLLKEQKAKLQSERVAQQKTIEDLQLKIANAINPTQDNSNDAIVTRSDFEAFTKSITDLIESKLAKKTDTVVAHEPKSVVTYASVVNSDNPENIRTVVIAPAELKTTLAQLRSDTQCHEFGMTSIRQKAPGVLTIRSKDGTSAQNMENYLIDKYANKLAVNKPKSSPPQVKLVGVPIGMDEAELKTKLEENNEWLAGEEFNIARTYSMKGKKRDYGVAIVTCSLDVQCRLIEAKTLIYGFTNISCFEHVELQSCGNCGDYSHHKSSCKNKLACRHCAEDHIAADCPNRNNPPICAACKRSKHPYNHSTTSHFCKARSDRIEGLKTMAPKN